MTPDAVLISSPGEVGIRTNLLLRTLSLLLIALKTLAGLKAVFESSSNVVLKVPLDLSRYFSVRTRRMGYYEE